MKILMVTNSLRKGGRERRLLELVKGLLARNEKIEVYLISLSELVDYQYVFDMPIRVEIFKKKDKDFGLVFKLRKRITEFKPDIIHSWDVMASLYLTLANFSKPAVLINGVISDAFQNMGLSNRVYLRVKLLTPFSKVIVANSIAGLKAYNIPESKGACIYNGIDLKRFDNLKSLAVLKEELFGKADRGYFIGVMVASFEGLKDYSTLISAAISLCRENKNFVFLLIGGGSELETTKATVPSDLADKQIIFLGKRNDVEDVLQVADVGLLITPSEGVSNAILEYMASRKPVIATVGGGTSEVVKDGVNGFLIEQKNPSQIIEKMKLLYDNRDLAKKMGDNGRKLVEEQFNVEGMTEKYVELYNKYLGEKITKNKIQPLASSSRLKNEIIK